ncbi:hypothetical protein VDGD_21336 [Verticillium dahliae]|nr:hypothetical protein VDGD_21336 [Verticillium dahliae]
MVPSTLAEAFHHADAAQSRRRPGSSLEAELLHLPHGDLGALADVELRVPLEQGLEFAEHAELAQLVGAQRAGARVRLVVLPGEVADEVAERDADLLVLGPKVGGK